MVDLLRGKTSVRGFKNLIPSLMVQIERNKTRLVAKSYTKKYGGDFEETFARIGLFKSKLEYLLQQFVDGSCFKVS